MKLIPLTQGKFAQVDDEDYDYLMQWKWQAASFSGLFYAIRHESSFINNKRPLIRMHRLLLKESNPKIFIDHADRDTLNNQKYNLRKATQGQNNANRKGRGASKYLGVHVDSYISDGKRYTKWKAAIKIGDKIKNLGRYKTEVEAALAYNKAARIVHGEFANLNKIIEPRPLHLPLHFVRLGLRECLAA